MKQKRPKINSGWQHTREGQNGIYLDFDKTACLHERSTVGWFRNNGPNRLWGGGGSKTKEILMKNIGVKVLITNRIIWNSKQTKKKQGW